MIRRRLPILALVGLLAAGLAFALWSQIAGGGNDGRDDIDLTDRLDPARPEDEHLLWAIDAVNGAPVRVEEVDARISEKFADFLSPAEIVASLAEVIQPDSYRFEGVLDRGEGEVVARLRDGTGRRFFMQAIVAADDPARLDGLLIQLYEPPARTHTLAQTITALGATALLFVAAARFALVDERRLAALFVGSALLWLVQFAERVDSSLVFLAALILPWLGFALAAMGVVDAAGHRRLSRQTLAFVMPAVAATVVIATGWLVGLETADLGLADNALAKTTSATTVDGLLDARAYAAIGLALAFACVVLGRHLARPSALRFASQPFVGGAVAAGIVIAILGFSWLANDPRPDLSPPVLASVALLGAPFGVVGSAAVERLRLGEVARLVVDLGEGADSDSIEGSLRRALNDPELRLLLWSEERGVFLDVDGRETDPSVSSAAMTRLDVDGRLLAAVLHEPDHRPDQIRAACSAVRLAIENLRLHAEVTNQLIEVRASRARLLTATDDARRQLERDLHDGAQQGMLAVLLDIQRARRRLPTDPVAADAALDDAATQLEKALAEVRDLARGLHPGALDRGLVPAIREIADRCPVPVEVTGPRTRVDPAIEQAAYYVVSEALTNVGRHAEASSVSVRVQVGDTLVVTIADDGNGRAEVGPGGGLEGIIDRAEALGGHMIIDAVAGCGTTIGVDLPLRSPKGTD